MVYSLVEDGPLQTESLSLHWMIGDEGINRQSLNEFDVYFVSSTEVRLPGFNVSYSF